MKTDYITLPVSALKSEATRVFEALSEGRTVYVSKHGDIVAEVRPSVPMEVVAVYGEPGVQTFELTARDMGQSAPTKAVNDATAGLPSLVTRKGKVYGVLAAAELPAATNEIPDLDAAEARSTKMKKFIAEHPDASIEDISKHRQELGGHTAARPPAEPANDDPVASPKSDYNDIHEITTQWRQRGSTVEGTVQRLLNRQRDLDPVGLLRKLRRKNYLAGGPVSSFVALRESVGLVETDAVAARTIYINALIADSDIKRGVMWRLGDLARKEAYPKEAANWYRLALGRAEQTTIEIKEPRAAVERSKTSAGKKSPWGERAEQEGTRIDVFVGRDAEYQVYIAPKHGTQNKIRTRE